MPHLHFLEKKLFWFWCDYLCWAVTQGKNPSLWTTNPSNVNQIDPANGKSFGYFLPKITVK
ncbi:hypothetical protein [Leptospira brenneri]|uniref:hypothetical protein n=1 Tax=Leptospira brenneri TaxID=2023182 RepID=UPI0013FE02A8|nr:hypothetical protein [Leptospira brenneri]